jgi:hypothetical protein
MDFPTNFSDKNDFLSCLRYVPRFESWSDLKFCEYYDHLLKMRHNALQLCLCEVLFGKWEEEKEVCFLFPGYDGFGANLTPDIVFEDKELNKVFIIDVGVTKNYYEMIEKKKEKYEPLRYSLQNFLEKEVVLRFFIFDLNKYNFLSEEKNFFDVFHGKRLDESFFNVCMQEYDTKRSLVDEHVDRDVFHQYIRKKYGILDEFIGMKKDTQIPIPILEEIFNRKYPYDLNLTLDEDQILSFSEEFLNNENLKNNYYDKDNTPQQYHQAWDHILGEQQHFESKNFVTLANLFPSGENILPHLFGETSEQRMILNFCQVVNDKWLEEEEEAPVHCFVKDLIKHLLLLEQKKCLMNKFSNGYFYSEEEDQKLKDEYFEERSRNKKTKSFYNYLANKRELPHEIEITRPKSVIIPHSEMSLGGKSFYTDSGTQFYRHKFLEEKRSTKKSQSLNDSKYIDFYLDYFIGKDLKCYGETLESIKRFLLKDPEEIYDSDMVKNIKRDVSMNQPLLLNISWRKITQRSFGITIFITPN